MQPFIQYPFRIGQAVELGSDESFGQPATCTQVKASELKHGDETTFSKRSDETGKC